MNYKTRQPELIMKPVIRVKIIAITPEGVDVEVTDLQTVPHQRICTVVRMEVGHQVEGRVAETSR